MVIDSDKCIKTKAKSYGDNVNTNFQEKKSAKRKCIIQIFVIDNVRFCSDHPQTLLEECKYKINRNKMEN